MVNRSCLATQHLFARGGWVFDLSSRHSVRKNIVPRSVVDGSWNTAPVGTGRFKRSLAVVPARVQRRWLKDDTNCECEPGINTSNYRRLMPPNTRGAVFAAFIRSRTPFAWKQWDSPKIVQADSWRENASFQDFSSFVYYNMCWTSSEHFTSPMSWEMEEPQPHV